MLFYAVKIPIIMEQGDVMLNCNRGDHAINRISDGDAAVSKIAIHLR